MLYFGHGPTLKTWTRKFIIYMGRVIVHSLNCSHGKLNEKTLWLNNMVVTAVFLGVIVAGLSILDIYLLKQCFGQQRGDEDGEPPAFPVTVPYYVFAR